MYFRLTTMDVYFETSQRAILGLCILFVLRWTWKILTRRKFILWTKDSLLLFDSAGIWCQGIIVEKQSKLENAWATWIVCRRIIIIFIIVLFSLIFLLFLQYMTRMRGQVWIWRHAFKHFVIIIIIILIIILLIYLAKLLFLSS